jgi:mono/diheme cytochrome c family protein
MLFLFAGFVSLVLAAGAATDVLAQSDWTVPPDGEKETSPLTLSPDVLKRGRATFERSCRRCHGPEGRGDGPGADPRNPAADLTDPSVVDSNTEGVLFYRIWNGKPPVMPAFKSQLPRNEIWGVVEYVKSLRKSE